MANFGSRLQWASDDGPEPEIELSDEKWLILENCLNSKISSISRTKLIEICYRYFYSVRPELTAASESDVKKVAKIVKKKIDGFTQFLYQGVASFSNRTAPTDAEVEFEQRIDYWLKRRIIPLRLEDLQLPEQTPPNILEWLEKNNISLKLSSDHIFRTAMELNVVVMKASEGRHPADEIHDSSGFTPGRAFKSLMVEVCNWAKEHQLPRSLFKEGEAGYLPCMLFAFHIMFPVEFQKSTVNSAYALAQQMKVAKAEWQNSKKG